MPSLLKRVARSAAIVVGLLSLACSQLALADEDYDDDYWSSGVKNPDPWEKLNRPIFKFNDTLDRWTLKPIATGYRKITPEPVRRGVHNVFLNIGEVRNFTNNVLQAKFHDASIDTARFMFNTTFGVLGVFDVATPMGLQRNHEDFGQTLGKWGIVSGPYVVLPLFGPSSVRDTVGMVPDYFTTPYPYISNHKYGWMLVGVQAVDLRSELLPAENLIIGDRYVFIRNAYLQNREYLVKDGDVEDDF